MTQTRLRVRKQTQNYTNRYTVISLIAQEQTKQKEYCNTYMFILGKQFHDEQKT